MTRLIIPICTMFLAFAIPHSAIAQTKSLAGLPPWVMDVGARREPKRARIFSANSYGAPGDGVKKSTKAIQEAIDACSKAGGGIVTLSPGQYVTGALFLKSNTHLRVSVGVTLLASTDDEDYPSLSTRVAGIYI